MYILTRPVLAVAVVVAVVLALLLSLLLSLSSPLSLSLLLLLSLLVLRRHSERSEESPHFRGERSDPSAFSLPPTPKPSFRPKAAHFATAAEKPASPPQSLPAPTAAVVCSPQTDPIPSRCPVLS